MQNKNLGLQEKSWWSLKLNKSYWKDTCLWSNISMFHFHSWKQTHVLWSLPCVINNSNITVLFVLESVCLDNFLLFRKVLIVTVTCMNQLLFNCNHSLYSSTSILVMKALHMFTLNLCLCQKSTKNSLETGRTFATLLSDIETRQLLIEVETEEQFKVCSILVIPSQSWPDQ